jgi:hypothetical protein
MSDIPLWAQLASAFLGSSVVAGVVGAFSSSRTSRQKFKELDILYRQKLEDILLANARPHIDVFYMPLSATLTKLKKNYHIFLDKAYKSSVEDEDYYLSVKEFQDACEVYISEVTDLLAGGKDIYLTTELNRSLNEFTGFIRASLIAKKPVYAQDMFGPDEFATFVIFRTLGFPFVSRKKRLELERGARLVSYAPVSARLFQERFFSDMDLIKSLMREVTLGQREDSTWE